MFVIPFIVGVVFLAFEFIFTDSIFNINILMLDDDKGLDVQVSKQAMQETAAIVSDGVNKFAANVGGYGTAAVAAAGIKKVVTSGAPLGAKAVGVVGLSLIGTAGALSPAVSKMLGYNKGGAAKSNSDISSNHLVSFDNLEYCNIVDIYMLKFFLTFILFLKFLFLRNNLNYKKVNVIYL